MGYTTINGYNTYDVMSALQKSVRRGIEEDAIYWAFEMAESNLINVALGRLKVMAHEDIGMGHMISALFAIRSVEDTEAWYPGNGAWRLSLSNAVMSLCRAPKSRDADNIQAAIAHDRRTKPKKIIPDYVYDKHTRIGRAKRRGTNHFVDEATILKPDDMSSKDYKERARAAWLYADTGKPLYAKKEKKEKKVVGGLERFKI